MHFSFIEKGKIRIREGMSGWGGFLIDGYSVCLFWIWLNTWQKALLKSKLKLLPFLMDSQTYYPQKPSSHSKYAYNPSIRNRTLLYFFDIFLNIFNQSIQRKTNNMKIFNFLCIFLNIFFIHISTHLFRSFLSLNFNFMDFYSNF